MNSTHLARAVLLSVMCVLVSCTEDNASPKCDNDIALAGVKGALYGEISPEGDQRRFFNTLDFKDIEMVKMTEEGRICAARLTLLKKYYLPINYEIAIDENEYYVTFSGIDEGSKENIYRIVNGMRPNLAEEQ
jgi:hypothetical protein